MRSNAIRSSIVTASLMLTLLCGCAGEPAAVKPKTEVDMAAWRAEVVAQPGALADPDMDALYDAAVGFCGMSVERMTVELSYPPANPDYIRQDMSYVCPTRAHIVDDALRQGRRATGSMDQACATPPARRTPQQQQAVDALGGEAACAARS